LDREVKLALVVHAEMAALLQAGRDASGATLYCTAHPCGECAKAIVEAGIGTVVCPSGPWRDDPAVVRIVEVAQHIFKLAGVRVEHV
jgi:dCMP deaminase